MLMHQTCVVLVVLVVTCEQNSGAGPGTKQPPSPKERERSLLAARVRSVEARNPMRKLVGLGP
jgi:hypothetical protein